MTDIAELHARALDATGRIVDGVAADRWHAATPCPGWDARGLVNHLVAGNLRAAELAAGGTIEGAGSRLDGDLLGDDPAAAYAASASAAAAVFRRPEHSTRRARCHTDPYPARSMPGTDSWTCWSMAGTSR